MAKYRKIFPWRPWEKLAAGNEVVAFDMPGVGRIGLMICYDGWFPEIPRNLAWMGAEVILHPSATTTNDRHQEVILARATAIVNQVYMVNVNAAGTPGLGMSIAADPEGRVVYQAGEGIEFMPLVLNLDNVALVREHGSVGLGSRPIAQFEDEAAGVHWPMYEGGKRGEIRRGGPRHRVRRSPLAGELETVNSSAQPRSPRTGTCSPCMSCRSDSRRGTGWSTRSTR